MNAIYKIKYSRSRGQYVVVHEYVKSHQKGRLSAAVVTALLSGAMSGVPAVYASTITPEADWKHTTVTETVTGRFDITTNKTQVHEATNATIGINRFEQFELSQKHIANLHHATGSSTLVNFVNQKITVDGTVNSVVNQTDIGGELVFISPQGMVVGATGVINTGSLTVAAPTDDKFKDWRDAADDAHQKSNLPLDAIRQGEIPMNRRAVITIDGSINAGNQVTLAAISIDVGAKGSIRTDVTDFSNLVNINQDETVLASGVTTAQLTGKLDASGDIILSSIADTSGTSPDTNVTIIHESTAAKVDVKGSLKSRKDVKVKALAGNGTYLEKEERPKGWTEEDGHFSPNGDNHVTTVKATVNVAGDIEAANNINVNAIAENRLDDSGIGNLAKELSFEVLGSTTRFNFDFGFGNLTTQAAVTVGDAATLVTGKDLTVEALADTRMTIGAKTSFAKALDLLKNTATDKIPTAAALVGLIDNDAAVTVNGTMKAGQATGATDAKLTVGAKSHLEATLSAASGTVGDDSFLATVSVGIFDSHAKTTIAPQAIVINDTAVNFYADQTSSIETSALTSVQAGSTGGVSFNYTEHNSGADLIFTGDIANGATSVTMAAKNVTQAQKVIAEVGVAPLDFLAKLYTSIVKAPVNFVAGLMGKAAQGIDTKATEENFRLGGAVAVVVGQQTASLAVTTGQQGIKAAGDVNLQSTSRLWDHHYKVSSRVNSKANSASLAVLVTTPGVKVEGPSVISSLTIADNAIIESTNGNVTVLNEAMIEWNRVEVMKNDLNQFWTDFKKFFTAEEWEKVSEAFNEVGESFSEISETETFLDGFEQFGSAVGTLGSSLGTLFTPFADMGANAAGIVTTLLEFASPISYMNAYVGSGGVGAEGAKFAAAGSIAVVMQETKATTTVGKNALIRAIGQDTPENKDTNTPAILRGRVTIIGRSENDSLLLGGHLNNIAGFTIPNIQGANVNAVGAAVILNFVTTDNVVRIREGASLIAENALTVKAVDDMDIVTIGAASDITSGSLGVDILAASTITDASNILEIDDEANFNTAVLGLEALRDDSIQTIAGSILVSTNSEGGTSAGMAIGMNFGSIANKIEVKDNDELEEGEASVVNMPGYWIATDSIETVSKAHVATNAIGVAGSIALAGKSDDTEPGAFEKLGAFIGKVTGTIFGGINKVVDKLGGGLNNIMYTGGDKIHKHFTKNQNQNANDADALNNEAGAANEAPAAPNAKDVSNLGEENATTTDTGSTDAAQTEAGKKFSISLAGSAAWTQLDLTTIVDMKADGLTIHTPTANFDAISDKWMGSWAGTAAVNVVLGTKNGQSRMTTVGVSGAVAGNSSHSTAGVYISAANDKRIHFENPIAGQGTDLRIYSINDGTIVSEGLVATVGTGQGSSYAFEASVSANLYKSTTDAKVGGITVEDSDNPEDDKDNNVDIAAYVGEWQTTGGTAFGLTLGGDQGKNASVGMIVAVADIENTASAELKNAEINANTIDVRALSGLDQITTAVNAQIAASGRSSFGFTGTAGTAALTNTVTTTLDNVLVTLEGANAYFDVASRVATDEEVTALEGLANHQFAFDNKLVYQDEDGKNVSARDNANLFKDVSLYTDATQSAENAQDVDDFVVGKNMLQTTVVFSLGVSTNGSAAGASVLVNQIDNTFKTDTNSVTVNTASNVIDSAYAQVAYSDVTSIAVVAGATGASGLFSAAGSVIVSEIDQHAETIAKNLMTYTHQSGLTASNEALTINVAGNVGVSTGSGQSGSGGAVGGAVIVSNVDNKALVTAQNVAIHQANLFEAKAINNSQSWGATVAATIAKNLSFGGSVLVHRTRNDTDVTINGLSLTDVKVAEIEAFDTTELWSLAGNVTVAYDSSGVGIGGAVVYAASGKDSIGTDVTVTDLTVNTTALGTPTDFSAKAHAKDLIQTLVLSAGVTTGYAGFGGSAATNEIRRHVSSSVSNVTAGLKVDSTDSALKSLSIQALEKASIGNIVIAAGVAGSSGAGIGVGVAVNRIDNATLAKLSDTQSAPIAFNADLLKVKAYTDNDIDTIGVGGAGSGTAAITGSVAVNSIEADTTTEISKAKVNVKAAAVEAQSDDTIGTYGGQGAGGKVAVGMSVTVTERGGETAVKLTDANITEKTGGEIAEVKGAVSDDDVSGLGDFSTTATLAQKRTEDTVKGIAVRATSTETFKTLVINAAGGQVAVNGTTNVIYSNGQTRLDMSGMTINTQEGFDSLTADYTNISTSMSTASGGQVAVAAGVNVTTAEHLTETKVTGTNTLTGNVNMHTEAVESIANVLVTAAGSMYASVAPTVSVNRLLSDVKSNVSGVTGSGSAYAQTADYLGVVHNVGVGVAGAAYASVGAAVQINYFDNDVLTSLANSHLTFSGTQNIEALRRTDLSLTDVVVSGSIAGVAASVNVNTIEGSSETTVSDSIVNDGDITIEAEGKDNLRNTNVLVAGGVAGVGATVIVNNVYADAKTNIQRSTIDTGKTLTVKSHQNRLMNQTLANVAGGVGAVQANVIVNNIGSGSDLFATTQTGLQDTENNVNTYLDSYAGTSSSTTPGLLGSLVDDTHGALTQEETQTAFSAAANTAKVTKGTSGTRTVVTGSVIKAKTLSMTAEEDTASDQKMNVDVGSGSGGIGALAASVATLRYSHAAAVDLASSQITTTQSALIGTLIGGQTYMRTVQATVALGTGFAAYVDAEISGGGAVNVMDSDIQSTDSAKTTIRYKDTSDVHLETLGVTLAGAAGGGMVADLRDKTSSGITVNGQTVSGATKKSIVGNTAIESIRAGVRRVKTMAAYGGGAVGVGSLARVTDSGKHFVTVSGTRVTGNQFEVLANNQATLMTKAWGDGGAGVAIGVVEAFTTVDGRTDVTLKNNALEAKRTSIWGASGRETFASDYNPIAIIEDKDKLATHRQNSEELTLLAEGDAYSGGGVAINVNTAQVTNNTKTNVLLENNTANNDAVVSVNAVGFARSILDSDVAGGGAIYSGNTRAYVTHGAEVKASVINTTTALHTKDLSVASKNTEKLLATAQSYGGGVLTFEGATNSGMAAQVIHKDTSSSTVNLGGSLYAAQDLMAKAESDFDITVEADNAKGAVVGVSGSGFDNSMKGRTGVYVAANATLDAQRNLSLDARTDINLRGKNNRAVDAQVYGAVGVATIRIDNEMARTNEVEIGQSVKLSAQDALTLSAFTDSDVELRVRAASAGLGAGTEARANHTITTSNLVTVGESASIRNVNSAQAVILSASSDEDLLLYSVGDVQGAAVGFSGAYADIDYTRHNKVTTKKTSKVYGAGNVKLLAGQNPQEKEANLKLDTQTESYAYSLGAPFTTLGADFVTNDQLTVAGDVKAVRSITAFADQGDVFTIVSARHYGIWDGGGEMEIATSAVGNKSSHMTENSLMTVNGTMVAGLETLFDLTISGTVDVPASEQTAGSTLHIEGSSASPKLSWGQTNVATEGKVATTVVDQANVYYERHEELLKAMELYGKDDSTDSAYAILKAEDDFIISQMIAQGWATRDDNGMVNITNKNGEAVHNVVVKNVTVSGGNIDLTTGSVTGAGVISANAAEGIKITNQTNLGLTLENLVIWEKGGQMTLNDTVVKTLTGFSGTTSSALTLSDPVLSATSNFGEGQTVTLKGSSGLVSETKVIDPDNTVTLQGTIANHAGEVSVTSADNLLSFADVSAAGALHLSAKGSITQTYTSGIVNIGGSVSALWKTETDSFYNGSSTSTSSNTVHKGTGAWIAGDSIFIAGDTINVNGYIQSGYAEYGVTLDETTVTTRINEIRSQWKRAGSKTSISPKTYVLQEGGYYQKGDAYAYRTTVWYDPIRDRIVLDDITPTGGQVYLAGRITNTGGGVIRVADGHATVNVNVGNHSLLTGAISTEAIKGQIEITDTGKEKNPVTTITSDQNVTSYSPSADIFYSWALGKGTTTTKKYHWQKDFTLWGAINYNEINWPPADSTTTKNLDELAQVEGVSTVTRPNGDGSHFYAWTNVAADSGEVITYENSWTDYGFLWFGGTHYAEKVTTQTKSTQYLYSVRGDLAIDVGFLKGNNSVTLVTGKDLYLGGNVNATAGTVSLTANGNILNERKDLAIIGANHVTLKATTGSIGSGSNAISLRSSTGTVNLNAQAGQSIYLDANHLGQDALLSASHIEGTKRIDVQARDNLSIASLIGTDISLSSAEGNIVVSSLTQKTSADYSERFDATAKSQGADITLTSVNGDLAIGEIEAADTVTINATARLADALDRTDEDEETADERLQKWADAGILNIDASGDVVDGTNPYTEYITNLENRVKGEFARYQKYVEYLKPPQKDEEGKTPTPQYKGTIENLGSLRADYEALKAKFSGCADEAAAVAQEYANADSALAKMKASEGSYGAWTRDLLLNAINEAIVNPDASTGSKAKVSNITAKFINVKAGTGLVGEELPTQVYKLAELQNGTSESKALLKLLARADVDDVEIDKDNKTLTLTLKRPITISQSEGGNVSAEGQSVYLQTLENEALTVNQIAATDVASGVVRITAGAGISGLASNSIQAATVTLHGGTSGGLGSSNIPLNINASSWMALTSVGDMFVNGTNTNGITILSLATNQTATLTSSVGIRSWAADETGVISAQKLKLNTNSFVGEANYALRIGQVDTIEVNNQLTGGLYLTLGSAGEVVLQTASQNGLTVTNDFTLTSIGSVKLQEAATAKSISLSADQGMTTKALEAANGQLTVNSAQGNVIVSDVISNTTAELTSEAGSVSASAISAQSVDVNAGTSVAVTTITANGTTNLASTNGNVSVASYKATSTASQLNVTANEGQASVTSMTTAGSVTINAKTLADTTIANANTVAITTTDNLTVGDVTTAGSTTLTSSAGAVTAGVIDANSVNITAKNSATVTSIDSDTELTVESGGPLTTTAAEGLKANSIQVNALGGVKSDLVKAMTDAFFGVGETDKRIASFDVDKVSAQNLTVEAVGAVDIGELDVTVKADIESEQGSIMLSHTSDGTDNTDMIFKAGTSFTANDKVLGKSLDVDATDAITMVLVDMDGALSLTSSQGSVTLTKGQAATIDIDALGGNVSVQDGLTADTGNLDVQATGDISTGLSVIATAGNVTLDGQAVQVKGDIQGQNTSIDASGNVSAANIKATDGDMTAQISGELKATTILATDELTLTANQGLVVQTVSAQTAVTMNAEQGEVEVMTLEAPTVSVTASDDISITNLAAQTEATFESTTGDITLTQTVNPNGALILKATQGGIASNGIDAISLNATAAQAIALGSVATGGQTALNSTTSSVTASGKLDASAIDIKAQTFVNLEEVQSDADVNITTQTGAITVNDTLVADGDAVLKSATQLMLNGVATVASLKADAAGLIQTQNVVADEGGVALTTMGGAIEVNGGIVAEGKALLDAADTITVDNKIEASDVEVQAHGDVTLNESVFANGTTTATLSVQTEGKVTVAEGQTLSVANGSMTLEGHWNIGENVQLTAQEATVIDLAELTLNKTTFDIGTGGLSVTVAQALTMSDVKIDSEGDLNIQAQSVKTEGMKVNTTETPTAPIAMTVKSTDGDISLIGATLNHLNQLSVTATAGQTNMTLIESSVGTGGLSLTADKAVLLDQAVIDSEGQVLVSGQSVSAHTMKLNTRLSDITDVDITVKAKDGSVSLQGAQVDEVATFMVSATDSADLSGLQTDNTTSVMTSGVFSVSTLTGDVNLSGITSITSSAIDLESGAKMIFVATPKLTATTGSVGINAADSLDLFGATVKAATDIVVKSTAGNVNTKQLQAYGQAMDLYAAKLLTLESATLTPISTDNGFTSLKLRSGSDLNLLSLNGEITTPLTLKAGSMTLIAAGIDEATNVATDAKGVMQWGDRFINLTTTKGHLTINATDVAIKGADATTNSTLTATGGDLNILGHQTVILGNKAELTGENVSVTGGLTTFNIGLGARVTATNGDIWIVSDSDATLGGSIFVKATATGTSATTEPSNITIGAKGVLSVIKDVFEITAEEGSVRVFGGYGMSILNDLTVISKEDTYLLTNLGSLSVGNNATVMAGTESGIASATYGRIVIHAGDKLTFGDKAIILADDLDVGAGGDITFGNNPTLYGVMDGVVVKSVAGSIYMGEVLSVVSNATETLFEALAGDIVIEREAEVTTQNSSIKFLAGNDIIFKEHFTADGQGFVMTAGGDIHVYDDATVQTEFDLMINSTEFPDTVITAKGDITFGDNAHFRTTELLVDAGDWGTRTGGNITFGDGASMTTSILGISFVAVGDITFGKNAHFGTLNAQVDGEVDLMAEGNITLGDGASIFARDIIRVLACGDITLGEYAQIVDIAAQNNLAATPTEGTIAGTTFKPLVAIFTTDGDVTIGSYATVWGSLVSINAGQQSPTLSLTSESVSITETGGNVYLEHGARINAGRFNDGEFLIDAAQNVNIGGELHLATGSTFLTAQQGDITIENTTRIGTAGKMQVSAGQDINIGDGATFVALDRMADQTEDVRMDHAVNMSAGGAITIGQDARMVTNANVNIQAQNDITVGSGARLAALDRANVDEAGNLEITSNTGTTSFNENAQIYAKDLLNISAQEDVLLTGQSGLYSGGDIVLQAQDGSVVLNDTVRVGSGKFVDNEALTTDNITITAGQNIVQQNMSDNGGMGIVANTLNAVAGDDVSIGAVAKGLQGGNYFNDAQIEAGGDVVVAVSQNANLTINQNQGGQVEGKLKLVGQNGELTVGHDLSATGSVTAVAGGLKLEDIQSDSFVEIMMVNSDNTNEPQALNVGNISGQRVAISSQDASITVQSVTSTTEGVSVMRRSKTSTQAVSIGTVASAHEVNVFNANGAIASDGIKAANTVYLMTGYNGSTPARNVVNSAIGKVAILNNAPQVGDYFIVERFDGWDAAESMVGFVPMINIALQSLTQNSGIVNHDIKHAQDMRDLDHLKFFIHYEDGAIKPITPSIFNEWVVEMQTTEEDEDEIRI